VSPLLNVGTLEEGVDGAEKVFFLSLGELVNLLETPQKPALGYEPCIPAMGV
jgi:hypothetical protein